MAMADKEQSLKNKRDFSETDIIRKLISFYEMVLHDTETILASLRKNLEDKEN